MTRRIIQIYRGTTAQNDTFTGAAGELTMDTDRKEIRIHDGSTAGGNVVGLTSGFIAPFAGSTAPGGWLICDGSAISRTTYADLFAVIGTTYGTGDGSTTFNLPDLSGRLPIYDSGTTLGTTTNGKAPNISGDFQQNLNDRTGQPTGCCYTTTTSSRRRCSGENGTGYHMKIDASLSSSVYDSTATKITPAGVYTLWCIKY